MAQSRTLADLSSESAGTGGSGTVLASVGSMPQEALDQLLQKLYTALPGANLVVASPDVPPDPAASSEGEQAEGGGRFRVIGYTPSVRSRLDWTATSADYINAFELAGQHGAVAVLLLGAEANTLAPATISALVGAVLTGAGDLAVPRYEQPARSGLVNSAILYPVTRALFARVRFPLAPDLCFSRKAAERLATAAQRFQAMNQPDALLWPVSECTFGACSIVEVAAGHRQLPLPSSTDLNALLQQVTGSLFTDADAKATFWQRARPVQPAGEARPALPEDAGLAPEDVQPMIDSFRLAYGNLREIWQLVLPPQSLFGLKRLAEMPATQFRMADALWARIVYDFLLAFRLRTINRGHLLGALTPLYLAWAASHILLTHSGLEAERHVETQAAAFEADKAYLVSRWRWPDRFNP